MIRLSIISKILHRKISDGLIDEFSYKQYYVPMSKKSRSAVKPQTPNKAKRSSIHRLKAALKDNIRRRKQQIRNQQNDDPKENN